MAKTKIDWADESINPIKGLCHHNCWYCYAKGIYKRFKWDTSIRLDLSVFARLAKIKKPSRVFVCSTHDIMGKWIPHHWINDIIRHCAHPSIKHHQYIFLSKNPERYDEFIYPPHIWLGATITGQGDGLEYKAFKFLTNKSIANLKFISYEPMLGITDEYIEQLLILKDMGWLIIGGLTGHKWIPEIWHPSITRAVNVVQQFGIPVFIKNNVKYPVSIKEYPSV